MDIERCAFFFGDITREEAGRYLDDTADGTFLVRFSANKSIYVLSVMYRSPPPPVDDDRPALPDKKHIQIRVAEDGKYYLSGDRYFDSIQVRSA